MKFKSVFIMGIMSAILFTGCGFSTGDDEVTSTQTEKNSAEQTQENNTENNLNQNTDSNTMNEENNSGTENQNTLNNFIDSSGELYQLKDSVPNEVIATMRTNKGDIVLRIFPDKAPKAAENFITHAKDGYYNGVTFHRVIKDFMIQGGDPKGNGTGGESIWKQPFENEMISTLRSFRGALCMANSGLDTNGSQFYIVQNGKIDDTQKEALEKLKSMQEQTLSLDTANSSPFLVQYANAFISKSNAEISSEEDIDKVLKSANVKVKDIFSSEVIDEYIKNGGYPTLDYGYTIFGQVKSGMEVVDAIANVKTGSNDKPVEDIVINSIEIQ